jgi:hypothetical protein
VVSTARAAIQGAKSGGKSHKAALGAPTGGNDGILEIARSVYDNVGNVTRAIKLEMNHDDTTNVGIGRRDHGRCQGAANVGPGRDRQLVGL